MTRRVKLRMPPHIKYLEAAGALGDGRVRVTGRSGGRIEAIVDSSTGERSYRVLVEDAGDGVVYVYSDDNGTRYRGYVGYPIIAVMMLAGLLPRDERVEGALKGIPWKKLNEKYKKYSIVMEHVVSHAEKQGVSRDVIESFISRVKEKLASYKVYYRMDPEKRSLTEYM